MFTWLKKLFAAKRKPEPKYPRLAIIDDEGDLYREIIMQECFETGEMVMGNVDDKGNLHLKSSTGEKVISREDVLKRRR